MMRLIFVVSLILAGTVHAETETEIPSALDYFIETWNEGDLEHGEETIHPIQSGGGNHENRQKWVPREGPPT
jgi:hypothetical protein